MELYIVYRSPIATSTALRDLFIMHVVLTGGPDSDRKEVARNRLSPLDFAIEVRPLKTAFGDAVFEIDEHALFVIHTLRSVVAGSSFHEPSRLDPGNAPRRQVLPDYGVRFFDFLDLVIQQRCTTPPRKATACTLTDDEVTGERCLPHGLIDDGISNDKHGCPFPERKKGTTFSKKKQKGFFGQAQRRVKSFPGA